MLPEHIELKHPDHTVLISGIVLIQLAQNFELYSRLMDKPFLVSDDLCCDELLSLVVKALYALAKGARPEDRKNFVPVKQMVPNPYVVIA